MNTKLIAVVIFLFVLSNTSAQNTRKKELSLTLRKLKILLHQLQTKQFIVINTNKDVIYVENTPNINNVTISGINGTQQKNQTNTVIEAKDRTPCPFCEKNQKHNKKSICYFARYDMGGLGDYVSIEQRLVNTTLCTHAVFKYSTVLSTNRKNELVFSLNPDFLTQKEKDIKDLQNSGIPVLVTFETDPMERFCNHFGDTIKDATLRTNFINQVISILRMHGLDGIDIESNQPVCCKVPCTRKSQENFLTFMKEFYSQLKKNNFYLGISLRPYYHSYIHTIKSYEFPEQAKYLDWISILMVEAAAHWQQITGHISPTDRGLTLVKLLLKLKTDPKKIVIGFSCFGSSFNLKNPKENKIGDPVSGPGRVGKIMQYNGVYAFFEICEELRRKDWQIVRSVNQSNYASRGNLWISYDDPRTIQYKFQVTRNLGGVAAFHIQMDDYANICGCGHFPLLRAALYPECAVVDCV